MATADNIDLNKQFLIFLFCPNDHESLPVFTFQVPLSLDKISWSLFRVWQNSNQIEFVPNVKHGTIFPRPYRRDKDQLNQTTERLNVLPNPLLNPCFTRTCEYFYILNYITVAYCHPKPKLYYYFNTSYRFRKIILSEQDVS